MTRIEADGAKLAYDARSPFLVDVRALGEYQSEHVPGGLSMPLDQIQMSLGELPREARIITYCT